MNARVLLTAVVFAICACGFNPDLSRFQECSPEGACPTGFLCLTQENRCVPECGENCPSPMSDAGIDAGVDSGVDAGVDAGTDAGTDAGMDAGEDAGVDAGTDAGMDAGPVLALAAMTLPAAIETKPYSVTFVPTGGEGQYHFSMDGGVPSFTLSVTGTLATGAAANPGATARSYPFTITVQDDAQPRGTVTTPFSLEVRPFLRVASSILVEGRQNQAYLEQLSATGGQPPYTWFVDGGMPPPGTSLSDAGVLQGAPTNPTTVSFGVTVVDSATPPQSASRSVTVQTRALDLVLAIATVGAPDGRVGIAYNLPLKAYAGSPAYTWSITTGSASLPPGILLTNAGSSWSLTGTPTSSGTFPFTIKCEDSLLSSKTQALSITVY